MTLTEEIAQALKLITHDDIARVLTTLQPMEKGEVEIGFVGTERIQRLWALRFNYYSRQSMSMHAASFDAQNQEEKSAYLHAAGRYNHLGGIVKDIAWGEMKDLFGAPAWEAGAVGLRSGWTLVSCPEEESGVEIHALNIDGMKALGIPISITRELVRRMREKTGEADIEAETEDEEKSKKRKRRVQ